MTTDAAAAGQGVLDRMATPDLTGWTRNLAAREGYRWVFDSQVDRVVGLLPDSGGRAVVVVYLDGEDFEHDDEAFAGWLADYRRDYTRGWRYSQRETATLDHLDSKHAPDAEYDGYLDYACGREKWHLLRCQAPNCRASHG